MSLLEDTMPGVIVLPSISTGWPPASRLKKGPAGTPNSRALLGSNRTFVMINRSFSVAVISLLRMIFTHNVFKAFIICDV
jgi:hypothetical protein